MIAAIIQNRAAAAPLMKKLRSRDESIHPVAMPAAASPATPKKAPPATTKRMDRSRRMTIYDFTLLGLRSQNHRLFNLVFRQIIRTCRKANWKISSRQPLVDLILVMRRAGMAALAAKIDDVAAR